MNTQTDTPRLQEIASMLSREICRPIDSLQANLIKMLDDPACSTSSAERTHAATMLTLCEDLKRLTWECLGDGTPREATDPSVMQGSAASRHQPLR